MELMFSKLASLETENNATKKAANGVGSSGGDAGEEGEDEEMLDLEPVAVQRFEVSLSGGHWGLHAYVPVTFSGVHFVRVDCMVRFRWDLISIFGAHRLGMSCVLESASNPFRTLFGSPVFAYTVLLLWL